MVNPITLGALALGLVCAGLGCYGAFEFAYKLEGSVTYLVLPVPVIAGAAALCPVIAEATWRRGHLLKALLWWAVLVPAGAVVFFSAAERVHDAKAGAEAERGAFRGAAARSSAALAKAEAALVKAQADANRARGQKRCGPDCRTKFATEVSAQADVDVAKLALLQAERKATSESPLRAPVWLLPAALDAVAFMATWTALSRSQRAPLSAPASSKVKRRAKCRPRIVTTPAKAVRCSAANDNVVRFPTA